MGAYVTPFFLFHPPLSSQFPPRRYGTEYHPLAYLYGEMFDERAGEIAALMTAFNAFTFATRLDRTGTAITKDSF